MTLGSGLGIDVGSTTVKVVAARDGAVVHRAYRRHHGCCLEATYALLREAEAALPRGTARLVTGSAGAALADVLGAHYVHEVHAALAAVRARYPRARTIIELGGQDAKMIHLEAGGDEAPSFTSEMNERCAAGTGATLDRCLRRSGLGDGALADLAIDDGELPIVSAKCGVFAEADVVALVKAGVARERVLGALLDAVVRGNLAVLAKGRPLPPQVVLLGGPHAFVPALAALWRRHLAARWREHALAHGAADDVIVPADAAFFAAEGALRSAAAIERVMHAKSGLVRRLTLATPALGRRRERAGLGGGGERAFEAPMPARERHRDRAGRLSLGIDAGSTTIKAVVLDEADIPIARVYRRAQAGPLEDGQAILEAVARELGADVDRVASLGVTGYAADVLGPVLGADASIVETLAHARSAARYVPDVEVACDIGGQDIKVLLIERGSVRSFHLSNQCAAGNGALLETTAAELGVELDHYAATAFTARRAPELTVGCAVFLDTQRVTCQRDGYTPAEILAGMAAVLPRNVWENVVAAASLPSLGRVFVLSGGVQRNQAVVKAEIDYIAAHHPDARVVVHPFPGEAGAIGAALAGREACGDRGSRFVGFACAAAMRFAARSDSSTRCRRCPSACARTFVDALAVGAEAARFVTGHACERGAADGARPRVEAGGRARNLLRIEAARLFAPARRAHVVSRAGEHLRVAIPRVLSMYRSAPFFRHYFEAIGVAPDAVVIGPTTSEDLWQRAAGRGTVDACFPVKVVHAHVAALLAARAERPFDVIWFPVLTHAMTAIRGCTDTASCPVVAGTPMVIRAAFGADATGMLPGGARLLTPTLALTDPEPLRAQLFAAISAVAPRLTLAEHDAAMAAARAGQRAFEEALEVDGAAALAQASSTRRAAIVMLARPYHADPGLHHDIGSELRAHGRTTLSIRALPKSERYLAPLGVSVDLGGDAPFFTNSGDGEKLAAARIVAAHPYLVAIELSSFKCGQDASIYGAIAEIAGLGGRPFLTLHDVDETRPVASLRLRLRTFLDAVERYERQLSEAR